MSVRESLFFVAWFYIGFFGYVVGLLLDLDAGLWLKWITVYPLVAMCVAVLVLTPFYLLVKLLPPRR